MNENAKSEENPPACRKCGEPCQAYTPGNYSVQCQACNELKAAKQRAARARCFSAIATLDRLPSLAPASRPPVWTRNKPTEPGRYWCKTDLPPNNVGRIRRFHIEAGKLEPTSGGLSTLGWDWFAGPLPEPVHD